MTDIFVIQNAITKEYFWSVDDCNNGFTVSLPDADYFFTSIQCIKVMNQPYFEDVFKNNILEIRHFYQPSNK